MSRIRPGSGTADPMLKPRPRRRPTGRNPFAEAFIKRQREKFNAAMPVTVTGKKPPTQKVRAKVDPDRRQPLRPQRVERVSVMPVDMKATDRGRPVTKIGNRTIYEADMREAKANQQNLVASQLKDMPIPAGKRYTKEQVIKLQKEAFRKMQQQLQKQQLQKQQLQKAVNPRTGKPYTPQQLKQIRANQERFAKEQATKQPLVKKFMEGSIGVRELRGTFTPREIRNIEKGRIAQQFMQGKITDRQLSSSGKFSLKEIRDIKKSLQFKRMSPEERRAFIEREQQRRQRRPDRRRRRIRDAFRRMREERRSRRGLRGRTRRLEKPTRGTAPGRYTTRRQQERATGVRIPRRGMRGPR